MNLNISLGKMKTIVKNLTRNSNVFLGKMKNKMVIKRINCILVYSGLLYWITMISLSSNETKIMILYLKCNHSIDDFIGEVISEEYSLEYGTDKIEMHVGAVEAGERALVIDDLIATGGTLCAAIRLLGRPFLKPMFRLPSDYITF